MQAFSRGWAPPGGVLGGILAQTAARVEALLAREAELGRLADRAPAAPLLAAALAGDMVGVVAEVKRRSPSQGAINLRMDASQQAAAYERGGAAALSVLTEPLHFGGTPDDLARVREVTTLPLLKKDFHVHPVQLVEAKALGASAALLIARALAPVAMRRMLDAASALELETLLEVRTPEELELALEHGARLIGVNARNLETLDVESAAAERVIADVPAHCLAVYESGIRGLDDVRRAARAGADAVLVGSGVSAAADPADAVRRLTGVPKERHARRG